MNNCIKLLCFLIAIVIMLCAITSYKTTEAVDAGLNEGNHIGFIVKDRTVEQTFTAKEDNLCSVEPFLATFARTNHSSFVLELHDSNGSVIASENIDASSIMDNAYYTFEFDPIADSKGREYSYCIYSDADVENAITSWAGATDNYPDGELLIDGEDTGIDLAFRLDYERSYNKTIHIFFIIVSIIVSAVFLILVFKGKASTKVRMICWSVFSVAFAFFAASASSVLFLRNHLFDNGGPGIVKDIFLFITYILFSLPITSFAFFRKSISEIEEIESVAKIKNSFFSFKYCEVNKSAEKMANTYAIIALITGLAIIYLRPPGTVPDEAAHLSNVFRMSSGAFFGQTQEMDDGTLYAGDYISQDEMDFLNFGNNYIGISSQKYTYVDANNWSFSHDNNANNTLFLPFPHANINPMGYLPAAFSTFIAKNGFGITSAYNLTIIADITNLVVFVFIMRLAIKNTPILRNTMFLIALFPMTLNQCTSTSYDMLAISGSMLLFAYGMKLIVEKDDILICRKDIAAICVACAAIFSSKIAYVPIMLILLAIPKKKFGSIKKYIMCIGAVAITGLIFYLIPVKVNQYLLKDCVNLSQSFLAEQRAYFLDNLNLIPRILINTANKFGEFWKISCFAQLGWLDTPFPKPYIDISLLVTFLIALYEISSTNKVTWKVRVTSLLAVFIFYVGVVITMFIGWTPVDTHQIGGDYATGIQGRYFIPILILFPVIIANPLFSKFKYRGKIESFMESTSIVSGTYFALMTIIILITRYWCN